MLALGVLTAGFALVIPRMPQAEGRPALALGGFMLATSLVYILPGIWGVVSGIGLLRLKNWARISTIVFSVLAGLGGAGLFALTLLLLRLPIPQGSDADPTAATRGLVILRAVMAMLSAALLGASIWFGVLLTRPKVVTQFTGIEGDAPEGRRPLSITIIGVLMLIGAPMMCLSLLIRAPSAFLLTILTGRAALVFSLVIAGTLAYCGWGLLRLKPAARAVAIAYFVFAILNSGVFFLAPGRDTRLTALLHRQQGMMQLAPADEATEWSAPRMLMTFGFGAGFVGAAVPLYFLIARRAAFEPEKTPTVIGT